MGDDLIKFYSATIQEEKSKLICSYQNQEPIGLENPQLFGEFLAQETLTKLRNILTSLKAISDDLKLLK